MSPRHRHCLRGGRKEIEMRGWKRKLAPWAAVALLVATGLGIEVAPTIAVRTAAHAHVAVL
jgi:hypothetical protein